MPKTHTFKTGRVLVGDCLDRLRDLPDASIDAVVTDPPYGLEFMGKDWDAPWKSGGFTGNVEETSTSAGGASAYSSARVRYQRGLEPMVAFQEWYTQVAVECLRVLKPGGYLLSFGGTRTYHRMACAIEDAGFEIRDSLHWSYGSGFPKSLDVSKAIDKKAKAKRKVVGNKLDKPGYHLSGNTPQGEAFGHGFSSHTTETRRAAAAITAPATADAEKWSGWGTALKPSHEPIVMARKPLIGTVADNVLTHGTGALNIDGCRVGTDDEMKVTKYPAGRAMAPGGGDRNTPEVEIVPHASGRWPANTILTHHADCQQVGSKAETMTGGFGNGGVGMGEIGQDGDAGKGAEWQDKETSTPVYECAEGCPVPVLDEQSGELTPGHWTQTKTTGFGEFGGGKSEYKGTGPKADKGGASRFFKQTEWDQELDPFIYIPKPSRREKNEGLDDLEAKRSADRKKDDGVGGDNPRNRSNTPSKNHHPTVKPVALMRYLIKLVTPPGGVVLDPFLGSGTTAVAAIMEGHEWVGVEYTPEYLPIIKGRVQHAQDKAEAEKPQPEQLDLLDAGA